MINTRRLGFLLFLIWTQSGGCLWGQTILGRLIDGESMQPVPWGMVRLTSLDSEIISFTMSDQEGDFVLSAPGPGEFLILVEAYSYLSISDGPVALGPSDTVGVEFFTLPDPELLGPLVVVARRRERRLQGEGFYRRMERGMGRFLTWEEIEDVRAHDMPGLLSTIPGIYLRPGRGGILAPVFLSQGRHCYPIYYLDGVRLMEVGEEISLFVHPSEIAAMEVYATRGETPARYREIWNQCATILIWAKR